MFKVFQSNQTYDWGMSSLYDIFEFSVYMKHSEIPVANHPNIVSGVETIYFHLEEQEIIHNIVVDNVPEDQVFLYCLLNCNVDCSEIRITNADSTKFEFSEDFISDIMEMMHEKELYYTILYYVLAQIHNPEDSWISAGLREIYEDQDDESEITYPPEYVVPIVSVYIETDHMYIDILGRLRSGVRVPLEILEESRVYVESWMASPNVKSARKI